MPIRLSPPPEYYYETEAMIFAKIRDGIPLTLSEEYMHCNCLPDTALLHHGCHDEFFSRLYWQAKPQYREEVALLKAKGKDRLEFEALAYEEFIKDWTNRVENMLSDNPLMEKSHVETQKELKILAKEFLINGLSAREYHRRKREIVAWSKYRYIASKLVADVLFTDGKYELALDGCRVILDTDGLIHIMTGHFGASLKAYTHSKSHFTQDFYHEDLPLQLQAIFTKIDESTLFNNQLRGNRKLVFGFRGIVYEVFFGRISGYRHYRIKTFYPVDDNRLAQLLSNLSKFRTTEHLDLYCPDK